MTKTCVVCKKSPVAGDNTRSFHKFPTNEDTRKQWMDATGVSKVTINCTVCSDHFTQQSYHQTDGSSMKRLIRNAVPNLDKAKINQEDLTNVQVESENKETSQNTESSQNKPRTRLSARNENQNVPNKQDNRKDQSSNESPKQPVNEKPEVDISNNLKRKPSPTNMKALSIKRMFRFRDGDETKYICRDEFVTEEAWEKFLRLMLLNKRRMEFLRQRICSSQRFNDASQQFTEVREEEMCGPEKFLEVILKE